ncbi:MAG: DUF3368 domain-containing protein [bacterium]
MEKTNKIVIFNSSPLINLSKIKSLDLIEKIYGQVIIPEAVNEEVVISGKNKENVEKIVKLIEKEILKVVKVKNRSLVKSFQMNLDYGESEVLALAIDMDASLIIIDEKEARQVADTYNLNKTGFIGILIKAEKLGLIDSAIDLIDLAIEKGFRINKKLYIKLKEELSG